MKQLSTGLIVALFALAGLSPALAQENEYIALTGERVNAALAPGAQKADIKLAEASLTALGWMALYGNDNASVARVERLNKIVFDAYNGTPRMAIHMDHTSEAYFEMLNLSRFTGGPVTISSEYAGITRRRVDAALAAGAGHEDYKLAEGSLAALGWLVLHGNDAASLARAEKLMNAAFNAWPSPDGVYMQQTSTAYAEMINLGRFDRKPAPPRLTALHADWLVLVALYHATGGPNWTNKRNWLAGPVSSWHGVTVEQDRVTTLDLHENQLSGTIPPELGQLSGLRNLYLYNNRLTGPIPPELGRLTTLWALWLDHNQLTGSIPAEVGQLTELQALVLTDNRLIGSIPVELGRLSSLKGLHLAENNLTGSIPPQLGGLSNLNDLRLYDNQLTGKIPPELGQIRILERMYLGSNQLSGTVPLELGNMRNILDMDLSNNPDLCKPPQADRWWNGSHLQSVAFCRYTGLAADSLALVAFYNATGGPNWSKNDNWLAGPVSSWLGVTVEQGRVVKLKLDDNRLTGAIPPEIGQLTSLRELELGGNRLTGVIPPEIGQLTHLEILYIPRNDFTGAIPPELFQLSNLEWLTLQWNQLTGPIPPEIGRLTRLHTVYLNGNQFSGPIPPVIGQLTHLKKLYLGENQLTGAIPEELDRLTNLEELGLGENRLSGSIPDGFGRLTNLEKIDLSDNPGLCKPQAAARWSTASQLSGIDDCKAETVVPSRAARMSSQGTDVAVTNFTLTNDLAVSVNITWLDGQGSDVQTDQPWIVPGQAFRIANGAKTYQSHWYAIYTTDGFKCSFSPRQGAVVKLSQLSACDL